ncbi:MAG: sec-independent translocase [Nocardioidaceae bacterium]
MFGMGWPEIMVVLIVAVLVFGPDKLPDLAKQAGRFVRTARQMMDNAKSDLAREMGDDFAGLKDLNLRNLDPREAVRRHVIDAMTAEPDEVRPGQRPLPYGDLPPYDADAT